MVVLATEVEAGLGYISSPCLKTKAAVTGADNCFSGSAELEAASLIVTFLIAVIKYLTQAT